MEIADAQRRQKPNIAQPVIPAVVPLWRILPRSWSRFVNMEHFDR